MPTRTRACRPAAFRSRLSAFRSPLSPFGGSRGLTLIELMITMVIMAIISAAILGTASSAMENARRSRTRSLVAKISGLVLERWDSYANRRVDIAPEILNDIETKAEAGSIRSDQRGQMLADARLLALRELMKMEMPDRWSDVTGRPLVDGATLARPVMFDLPSALTRTYYRRLQEVQANVDVDVVAANQRAECLYLTVMYGTADGEARALFSSQDIGDTDSDGAPEFLDGWGEPIQWIRWPAGFVSNLQPADAQGRRRADDHDPFDIYRRDALSAKRPAIDAYPQRMRAGTPPPIGPLFDRNRAQFPAFRLVPLIFSGGSDNDTALRVPQALNQVGLDPYATEADGLQTGSVDDESDAWRDNIHNHLIEY
ncbi:MAG TPA: prepilin-type N-terminal cleavage/methylation domain-containing protein [Lacipirellulaceae bacterium]|nr:prepilin-type N-terminal cleavage/methylation domain-containing protein [Lacipirellulaceae bacterium]